MQSSSGDRFAAQLATAIALAFFSIGNITAAPISIANAGFEDFVLLDGTFTRVVSNNNPLEVLTPDPIPGWSITPASAISPGTFNPTTASYPGQAPEGENVAYIGRLAGTISQTLQNVLEIATYTLSVDVGNRTETQFMDYAIQLLAGGNLLIEDLNTLNPLSGTFETSTMSYTASAGNAFLGLPIEVRLLGFGSGTVEEQINFDNVRLNSVMPENGIPEPGSIGLLGVGITGLFWRLRRTKDTSV